MSRLCRLRTKTHGEDGQWAYEEIQQLRQRVAELEKERDEEIARNRQLRNLIASLEEQKSHWNKQRDEYREAVSTMDSERSANATLTAERDALKQQRDELLEAAEAIEIDAEECLDFDECTAMLVPIDTYHKLMEAIASAKGSAA